MLECEQLAADELEQLRRDHYNATLVEMHEIHSELRIFRVRPDRGIPEFEAGQYAVLGLGNWEPRVAGAQAETVDESHWQRMHKRAYSVSCTLVDRAGRLVRVRDCDYLEFYVTLVRRAAAGAPALTPRLFALAPSNRLFVQPEITGKYTLRHVAADHDVVMLATGTGEAPHNAMLAELLSGGHRGRIVLATCARRWRDLAFLDTHRQLERRFANYRYLPLTTREPENVDPTLPDYHGKMYLQQYVASGWFERDARLELDPARVHVFLCGNPAMIGTPPQQGGYRRQDPQPRGMIDVLCRRGFHVGHPEQPGAIHSEKYWIMKV